MDSEDLSSDLHAFMTLCCWAISPVLFPSFFKTLFHDVIGTLKTSFTFSVSYVGSFISLKNPSPLTNNDKIENDWKQNKKKKTWTNFLASTCMCRHAPMHPCAHTLASTHTINTTHTYSPAPHPKKNIGNMSKKGTKASFKRHLTSQM